MMHVFVIKMLNDDGPESLFVIEAESEVEAFNTIKLALERIGMDAVRKPKLRTLVAWLDPDECFIVRDSHHGPMLENLDER